jgi:hypothetical protein
MNRLQAGRKSIQARRKAAAAELAQAEFTEEDLMVNRPHRTQHVLRTTSARACLPMSRDAVWASIHELVGQLWTTHTLLSEPPQMLIHSVSSRPTDEPDGWLTWSLESLSTEATRVAVSYSEQADGAPEPELDLLLCRLVASSLGSPTSQF